MDNAPKPSRRWSTFQLVGPPRMGYVFGSLILLCGLGELIISVASIGHVWSTIMGVYFTLWGLLMLLGARAKSRETEIANASSGEQGPTPKASNNDRTSADG